MKIQNVIGTNCYVTCTRARFFEQGLNITHAMVKLTPC